MRTASIVARCLCSTGRRDDVSRQTRSITTGVLVQYFGEGLTEIERADRSNPITRWNPVASAFQVVESSHGRRIGPYSDAIRVGGLVYTSGQAGIDPATGSIAGDSFEAQARQAFANLQAILEDAGSGLAQVIKVTCFLADPDAFLLLNSLFEEFFPVAPPVRSTPLVQLPRGLLFSIDAIAVVGS